MDKMIIRFTFLVTYIFSSNLYAVDFEKVQAESLTLADTVSSAWADYDNDNDLDLVVTFRSGEIRLYQNNQGKFQNVGGKVGLPTKGPDTRSAAWGDYDNDGDVDLMIGYANWKGPASNRLFRNEGGKKFLDVTEDAGLKMINATTRQINWIDYDNDGDLDVFMAQRTGRNKLYENNLGKFKDVSFVRGLSDPRRTVGSCWFDMDLDGDLDLFNANQNGDRDAFYRNDGEKFVDIAMSLDLDKPRRPLNEGSVACSVVDYDNDGDFDLYVGTYGVNHLYRNDGKGKFTDVASQLGISQGGHIVGSSWGDFDLDGRIDLYAAGYDIVNSSVSVKNYLFRNTDAGFVNVLPDDISKNGADHGIQWGDYDLDGDLDFALTSTFGSLTNIIYQNLNTSARYSLQVLVLDQHGHYTKSGAEVRVYKANTKKLLGSRLVDTGSGYDAQSAIPVHFGLSEISTVDVEVSFMSGQGRRVIKEQNIDVRNYGKRPLRVLSAD